MYYVGEQQSINKGANTHAPFHDISLFSTSCKKFQ
jgi:hypothetical protein